MKLVRILFLLAATIVAGCFIYCRSNSLSALRGNEKLHAIGQQQGELAKRLSPGLSKQGVAHVLGKPDNYDDETVWVWTGRGDGGSWSNLITENGFFIVFIENRLVGQLLKTTESDPGEVLLEELGYTLEARQRIEQILKQRLARR
jgi:hypothetical protein